MLGGSDCSIHRTLANFLLPKGMKIICLLAVATLCSAGLCPRVLAQETPLVVADFNKPGNLSNIDSEFGTWDKDPNDVTQSCRMKFVKDDAIGSKEGMSVRLEYDVDSPNPAYNGFWLKLDNADTSNYRILHFYIRGDAETGFTSRIKIEIKDKKGGKDTHVVENISEKWQKISIPLKPDRSIKKQLLEFTIVFDDVTSRPKKGAILIDEIEFSGARN